MSDTRALLADALASELDLESLKETVRGILDIKQEFSVQCPRCKNHFKTPFPHPEKIAKALGDLMTQAKGAPKQTLEVRTPQSLAEIYEMDEDALAQLAARNDN